VCCVLCTVVEDAGGVKPVCLTNKRAYSRELVVEELCPCHGDLSKCLEYDGSVSNVEGRAIMLL
jgi:hypothetical protein